MPDLSVFEPVGVQEDVRTQDKLFLTGWEYLWGTGVSGSISPDAQANMLDLAFNDAVASFVSISGDLGWDEVQDTQIVDISSIESVEVQIRFRTTAIAVNDILSLQYWDGWQWVTLETFDSGNQPPQVLTTYTYDVTAFLDSIALINSAMMRVVATRVAGSDYTVELDEARVRIKFLQPNVFDSISILESVSIGVDELMSVVEDIIVEDELDFVTTTAGLLPSDAQAVAWHDGTRNWRAWFDKTNSRIVFEYAADPDNSWTENVNARISDIGVLNDFCVRGDSSVATVVYRTNGEIKVRESSGYPATSFSWGSATTIFTHITKDYKWPNGSKDSSGYCYVTVTEVDGLKRYVVVKKSTNPNDTTSWDAAITLGDTSNENDAFSDIARTGDGSKMICLYSQGTSLYYKTYNGTVWESSGTFVATMKGAPFVESLHQFEVFYCQQQQCDGFTYIKSNGNVIFREYTYAGGMESEQIVDSNTDCKHSAIGYFYGKDYLVISWARDLSRTQSRIYYRLQRLSDSTWGPVVEIVTTSTRRLKRLDFCRTEQEISGFIVWEELDTVYSKSLGLGAGVFDTITAVENVGSFPDPLYVNVLEDPVIFESVVQGVTPIPVSVVEPMYVYINEVAQIIDLVIELGWVVEYNYVAEWVYVSIPILINDNNYETVSIAESVYIENPILPVGIYEDLSVIEDTQAVISVLIVDVFDALAVAEYVDMLDIVVEVFTVHDELSVLEEIATSLYTDPAEVLWGQTVVSSWPVTDKQNAEDETFNDQVAIVDTATGDGNVRWSAIDDTAEQTSDFIDGVMLNVRFRFTGVVTTGRVELSLNNGVDDTLLETFDSGNGLTVLTTKQYDVSAQLDTKEKINNVNVMLRGFGLNSPNIELDEVQLLVYTRKPEVSDNVAVVEDVTVYLDELFMSASEDMLITDVAILNDLVIELGVVEDTVNVLEVVTLQPDHLFMSAHDAVTIQENITIAIETKPLVYDEVSITEDATVSLETLVVSVNDTLSVAESVTVDVKLKIDVYEDTSVEESAVVIVALVVEVNELIIVDETDIVDLLILPDVFDSVSVIEDVIAQLSKLFLATGDDVSVSDVATMNDLVVELGPATEDVSVTEDVSFDVPADVAVNDTVSVVEDAVLGIQLSIDVYEDVAVVEFATITDIVIELGPVYDEVAVSEYISISDIVIELGPVYDDVSITEYVTLFDIVIELGPVYDEVAIAEYATLFDIVIELGPVYENISVTEYATTHDIVIELFAFDTVGVLDVPVTGFPLDVYDDVGVGGAIIDWAFIEELVFMGLSELFVDVGDDIFIEEYAQMLDIIVELPLLYEEVGISEESVVDLQTDMILSEDLTVQEAIGVDALIEVQFIQGVTVVEATTVIPEYEDLWPQFFLVTPRQRMFRVDKRGDEEYEEVDI